MTYHIKVGSHPMTTFEADVAPHIGSIIRLPYPTGGVYRVRITGMEIMPSNGKTLYRGEWV